MTPPPVSGQSYRIETGLEERQNYIRGGIGGGFGYIDNLYPASSGAGQFSEKLISLQPSIAFDRNRRACILLWPILQTSFFMSRPAV